MFFFFFFLLNLDSINEHNQQQQNSKDYGVDLYSLLNNSFQYLNNNDIFDIYFYSIQTHIFTTLKTEQQYLNTFGIRLYASHVVQTNVIIKQKHHKLVSKYIITNQNFFDLRHHHTSLFHENSDSFGIWLTQVLNRHVTIKNIPLACTYIFCLFINSCCLAQIRLL